MRTGIPATLAAAVAVLAVTAGCGSAASSAASSAAASSTGITAGATASSTAGTGASASPATAGFATPRDVVTGFTRAELAGHWSQVCSYLAPGKRSNCISGSRNLSSKPTGKLTVDGTVISGKLAMVKVTGNICLSGKTECLGNSNPEAGLPTGSKTFRQAYDNAVAGRGFSPVPCIKVNGRWYVNAD